MNPDPTAPAPTTSTAPELPAEPQTPYAKMEWLLDRFVTKVPGVTHALLASKDGLVLLSSNPMSKDWADTVAATVSGHASIARATPGARGELLPAQQVMIERADGVFLIMVAGEGHRSVFPSQAGVPGDAMVETLLGVLAEPSADIRVAGFEMNQLIKRFGEHMTTPVRQPAYGASAATIR
ncbi:putative regulator of Ras-like GTPase activity (Roadblock/LC7/MglB family) [Streptomyces umbrinus]|uniref:Regulator of Ras-like GTPase activity (Roadblock/LC7/MglB family) n=1 Tax=Streptomyces umbrinus TaxID=67370 RepID=A0ABU0T6R1_9ACTN|nr:roadblock/LC7 domain-containing protein [Streptomyces umbrinus]MDQ1031489.1 putative regulator of Ras-like GTPase activity (Roadblock/LC7/MglB family) [Streptomyces umbrinus]